MVTVLEKSQVSCDNRIVVKVRVTVHTFGAYSSDRSFNHWLIYLLLADGSGSVRANMRAKYEGYNNGLLEWSDLGYTQSTSEIRHWDFDCTTNTKVRDVADCIYQNGREKYDLKEGSGCRYWM